MQKLGKKLPVQQHSNGSQAGYM